MLSKQINITQPMLKGLQQLSPMPCHSTTGVGPEHCEGGVRTMARYERMKYYGKYNPVQNPI